jgi:hypothetical protein
MERPARLVLTEPTEPTVPMDRTDRTVLMDGTVLMVRLVLLGLLVPRV